MCNTDRWTSTVWFLTGAHGVEIVVVICERYSLHYSTIFLFSPSLSSTLFYLCFPWILRLANPFWVTLFRCGHIKRTQFWGCVMWYTSISPTQWQPEWRLKYCTMILCFSCDVLSKSLQEKKTIMTSPSISDHLLSFISNLIACQQIIIFIIFFSRSFLFLTS